LAKQNSVDWRNIRRLLDVQKALNRSLNEMIDLTKATLHENAYKKEEICKILDVTADELAETSLSANTLNVDEFELHKRALHVFSEAQRVNDFKETCTSTSQNDKLRKLGTLMNQSHESCSQLYDCSCPQLDELTQICRDSGAYGSRLTGAGWGGCAVSLIPMDQLDEFLSKLKSTYYAKSKDLEGKFQTAAFATVPSDGIALFKVL
jgi:N-acetylgalactosamine kinase